MEFKETYFSGKGSESTTYYGEVDSAFERDKEHESKEDGSEQLKFSAFLRNLSALPTALHQGGLCPDGKERNNIY